MVDLLRKKQVNVLSLLAVGLVASACQSTPNEGELSVDPLAVYDARSALNACLQDSVFGSQGVMVRGTRINTRYAANQLLNRCEEQFDGLAETLADNGVVRSVARQNVDQMREDMFNEIVERVLSGRSRLTPLYGTPGYIMVYSISLSPWDVDDGWRAP